ncbi:hypothetical protein KIN20_015306 [Parelaphostrongylus tenuis]|uniref:Uncharacterized protein n=1 Tax=Parelaphostrongylus tenuis TaxID=148309 RepID=A0AAD5N428_PARTN|nr:hypothetical protein KIN20_015306 [Parelaphostrongylus tenuis]
MMENSCIIVDSTVTGICPVKPAGGLGNGMNCDKVVTAINDTHLSISGSLMTTNIIMATWSRSMWQNVVGRAVRMLASRPFGSHFLTATATVGGN